VLLAVTFSEQYQNELNVFRYKTYERTDTIFPLCVKVNVKSSLCLT